MSAIEKDDSCFAEESRKTKRAREKLIKRWKEEEEKITPEALQKTADKIRDWIASHGKHRVQIEKKKSFQLFNANKDPAQVSKKVEILAQRLSRIFILLD